MPSRPPNVLPAITTGLAAATAAWIVWLAIHLPGMLAATASPTLAGPSGVAFALTILLVIAWGARKYNQHAHDAFSQRGVRQWVYGAISGLSAGLVLMLLLGSVITQQPDTTDQMADLANRFRQSAPMIVAGFLSATAAGGALAGFIGGLFTPSPASGGGGVTRSVTEGAKPAASDRERPMRSDLSRPWLARLALTLAVAMLPLIILGGVVTSTESGLAVPDAVTSYGSVSFLFPLSLMAEPRIFFEHNHRLLGSLVGLISIALMILTMVQSRPQSSEPGHPRPGAPGHTLRWTGLVVAIFFVILAVVARVFQSTGSLQPVPAAVLLVVLGVGAMGWTHAMIARARIAPAAAGLFALVSIQGIYGIVRVGDQLTWMAAFHGIFAQAVLVTAAMLVPVCSGAAGSFLSDPARRTTRRLGRVALVVLSIQLVLGAITRHYGGNAIPVSLHAAWSLAAVGMVLIVAFHCLNFDRATTGGRAMVLFGWVLIAIVLCQFLLGWWALAEAKPWMEHRPLPLAGGLDAAHAIAIREALVTTAHQALGAILLALSAGVIASVRPERDES